jgi:hypothetical protein
MPSAAAASIYLFGITAFAAGLVNLLYPQHALASLALPNTKDVQPASDAMALAAIGMGIYYSLAAYQENRSFFTLTVPMRLLTTMVFWGHGGPWRTPASWARSGAVLTGIALVYEGIQKQKPKRS